VAHAYAISVSLDRTRNKIIRRRRRETLLRSFFLRPVCVLLFCVYFFAEKKARARFAWGACVEDLSPLRIALVFFRSDEVLKLCAGEFFLILFVLAGRTRSPPSSLSFLLPPSSSLRTSILLSLPSAFWKENALQQTTKNSLLRSARALSETERTER